MRYRLFFALVFSSITILGAAPWTYPGTVEVFPTGVHPTDSMNVQTAVNTVGSPGTVVLKSTDASGKPQSFNFGGTTPGTGAVITLANPDITLTGDGWDTTLEEPRTKIIGGGGPHTFSPLVSNVPATLRGAAMVFAVNAPGVTIRELKLTSTAAATGVFISSANLQASDHPVVVERNNFTVTTYGALASYSAAFPVKIDSNVFHGGVSGQWIGFTLRPIATPPYDEPVAPRDSSGIAVRFPFEITNNRILQPAAAPPLVWVFGWGNAFSTDPAEGCRKTGTVLQCFQGDNGPVLISANDIRISPPGTDVIALGTSAGGLNHSRVERNVASGVTARGLSLYPYGHDNLILNNDFSEMQAFVQIIIASPDTMVSENTLGTLAPLQGALPVGLLLISAQYQLSPPPPTPGPVENCVIMKNDYRLVENGEPPIRSAILLASENDLVGVTGVGGEVKNNLVFESGRFPEGTGGARNNVQILTGLIDPATGMPYVHDNRIVGHPATEIQDPGIGQSVRYMIQVGEMLEGEE